MHAIDIVILMCVVAIVGLILYFNIWKNRKKPCKGCPYAKKCDKKDNKKSDC